MFRQSIIITLFIIIAIAIFQANIVSFDKSLSKSFEADKKSDEPIKSDLNRKKEARGTIPVDKEPVFVLVLDDFGYSEKNLEKVADMGISMTIAVLPNAPFSGKICSFSEQNGIETILHLPMEPGENTKFLETNTLDETMSDDEIMSIVRNGFFSVFSAKGVSNHMGSKATKDERIVNIVFDEIKKRKMYFLDSFTTQDSVCEEISLKKGIPYVKRDIFIDNNAEEAYIEKQLLTAEIMAREKDFVVALGHDRRITIDVLSKIIPQLRIRGIKFLTISEFIKKQEGKRDSLELVSTSTNYEL